MARTIITLTTLAATLGLALAPVAASANDHDRRNGWSYDGYADEYHRDDRRQRYDDRRQRYEDRRGYDQRGDGYQQNYYGQAYGQNYDQGYAQRYDQRGYYADPRRNRGYYDNRGQYRCRGDGAAGTIIGAIAGGLLGNSVAGRGDRTLGTIIGGGAGALAGRAIDRSDNRC